MIFSESQASVCKSSTKKGSNWAFEPFLGRTCGNHSSRYGNRRHIRPHLDRKGHLRVEPVIPLQNAGQPCAETLENAPMRSGAEAPSATCAAR